MKILRNQRALRPYIFYFEIQNFSAFFVSLRPLTIFQLSVGYVLIFDLELRNEKFL